MNEECYYSWSIVVQLLGIGGLAYYAFKTKLIADETVKNNFIQSTPVVVVQVRGIFVAEINGELKEVLDDNPGDV